MEDTIFAPSFGNRPSYFVGREAILNRIKNSLDSLPGSKERALIILGQRGNGKTVMLWEIADIAISMGYIVAKPTVSTSNMLEIILEKVMDASKDAIKDNKPKITGANVGLFGFSAGLDMQIPDEYGKSFNYKIKKIAEKLTQNGKGLIILIDELQANSEEIKQLVITYQEMVGEGYNVALVMAGLPGAISTVLNDKVLTFLNRATKIELDSLKAYDIRIFYEKSFNKLGFIVSNEQLDYMVDCTNGSPYMMQLIGHNITLGMEKKEKLSDAKLEKALEYSRKDFVNDICKTTLLALSDKDREFLYCMSMDDEVSDMNDVSKRMGVTPDYARRYRSRLVDAGVIRAVARGKVCFELPLVKEYLKENEGMFL